MAAFGEFKPVLGEIARYLRMLATRPCCKPVTTAGVGSIPEGLRSVTITKTSANTDTTTITLSDASTYALTAQGEVYTIHGINDGVLPKFTIAGGTWKWYGVKF
jgi:hypothetical protein